MNGLRMSLHLVLAAWGLTGVTSPARAQDIEPRAYSNAPVGVNFLIAGYAYTRGGLSFDAALSLDNAKINTSNAVLAYARVLDLWGNSGKFDAFVPYTWLSGTAEYQGDPVQRTVNGFANPAFRLSWNFFGAPALKLEGIRRLGAGPSHRRQPAGVGTLEPVRLREGSSTSAPTAGPSSRRSGFRRPSGRGRWRPRRPPRSIPTTPISTAATGARRSRSTRSQGHVIYGFSGGSWASLDGTYFAGGRSTLNGG